MQDGLIFLFLFVALAIGWLLGLHMGDKDKARKSAKDDTFSGGKHRLQLFFDSYNDESLERFINSLEVKPDTVGLHISIGKHFRTQGEVEKAILIHQNLMSHPELSSANTEPVIYELAKDYKNAGLFDRSESLLEQLLESKVFGFKARVLLLDIYEQEKEWQQAYDLSTQLDVRKDEKMRMRLAQYCCELADGLVQENRHIEAGKLFQKALSVDKSCVRATLALVDLDVSKENLRQAINRLRELLESAPEYSALALPKLLECTEITQSDEQYESFLRSHYERAPDANVAMALFSSVYKRDSNEAFDLLQSLLTSHPDVKILKVLLTAVDQKEYRSSDEVWSLVNRTLDSITHAQPAYVCNHCGFAGQQMHWHCPSCRNWQSIKPS